VPESLRWRYLLFEGHPALEQTLQWSAIGALFGTLLGIYPRVSSAIAGVLLYHLAPLESIIWTASPYARGLTLAPAALIVLACSRSGDRLAVTRERRAQLSTQPTASWGHGWPLRLIQLLVCQIYLFAAYGKLMQTGLSWSSADNMRRWFLLFNLDDRVSVFRLPGLWLADRPAICLAIGVGAVLLEWSFILALLRRGARVWLVPLALAFHVGILVTMNIHVGEAWLILLFVDWEWVRHRWTVLTATRLGIASPASKPTGAPA